VVTEAGLLSTGPTLAEQAYVVLRRLITEGELAQGRRVTERGLAAQLGVSATPVREAIRRLEQERLLERIDGRRLSVANPSLHRLYELNQVGVVLRGLAARLAAESATDEELAEIRKLHERSQQLLQQVRATKQPPTGEAIEDILEVTRQMHDLIDAAGHNTHLLEAIAAASAFDWATRVTSIDRLGSDYPVDRSFEEHRQLVDALLARDGARAEEVMQAHAKAGAEVILNQLQRDAAATRYV